MFIELWKPLQIKLKENNSEDSRELCKRLINDTCQDLNNLYDWEFMRDGKIYTLTAADQPINFEGSAPYDLSAAAVMYAYCTATADSGVALQIQGKRIVASANDFDITAESLTLCTTATATGATSWSHIDRFTKTGTTGDVVVISSSGTELLRMGDSDTEATENVARVTGIYNVGTGKELKLIDLNTVAKSGIITGYQVNYATSNPYYDLQGNGVQTLHTAVGDILLVFYQKRPRVLNQDIDRPEFPRQLWPKLIEASFLGYGLRAEDETDASEGRGQYMSKLQEIVSDWVMCRGQSTEGRSRVMPAHIRRRI